MTGLAGTLALPPNTLALPFETLALPSRTRAPEMPGLAGRHFSLTTRY